MHFAKCPLVRACLLFPLMIQALYFMGQNCTEVMSSPGAHNIHRTCDVLLYVITTVSTLIVVRMEAGVSPCSYSSFVLSLMGDT